MTIHRSSHLVPRLRFPEFQNAPAWSVEPLGRLFGERQETGFSELPLLSVTDRDGVVLQEETNRKITANANRTKYLRVVPGDIVYNTMRMWEGRSARVGIEGVVSPAYTVCRPNEQTNSYFFAYYFKTLPMIQQFRKYSQGLVKDTLNLKFKAFSPIQAVYPVPDEQHKVAECLGSLDELIAAENRKLEALQQHKQGLMQQLFPRRGDTVPHLRFSEFQDEPGWDLRELGDIVTIVNGGTPKSTIDEYWNGNIQWLTPKDMGQMNGREIDSTIRTISYSGLNASSAELIPERSVILSTRAPIGHLAINTTPMAFNQGCRGLVPGDDVDFVFLYYLLSVNGEQLKQLGAGATFKELSFLSLKEIQVPLPIIAEQKRIADCLSALDDMIAAAGRRLEALRQHKQGLMQQLFPSLDGQ